MDNKYQPIQLFMSHSDETAMAKMLREAFEHFEQPNGVYVPTLKGFFIPSYKAFDKFGYIEEKIKSELKRPKPTISWDDIVHFVSLDEAFDQIMLSVEELNKTIELGFNGLYDASYNTVLMDVKQWNSYRTHKLKIISQRSNLSTWWIGFLDFLKNKENSLEDSLWINGYKDDINDPTRGMGLLERYEYELKNKK
jgi:hypothetical protein